MIDALLTFWRISLWVLVTLGVLSACGGCALLVYAALTGAGESGSAEDEAEDRP
jgi:hypothetical protein